MLDITDAYVRTLVAVASLAITWYVVKWLRYATNGQHPGTHRPPCLPSLPLVGSLPFMGGDPDHLHRLLTDQTKKYGNVFALKLGRRYAVVLNGYEAIREALIRKSTHFADRAMFFFEENYTNVNMNGMFNSMYDEKFRRKHQLYLSILKELGYGRRVMETRISAEVSDLIHQARLTGGQAFDPCDMLMMCSTKVIASVMIGRRYPYGHPTLREYIDHVNHHVHGIVQAVEQFPPLRFLPPWRGRFASYLEEHVSFKAMIRREIDSVVATMDQETDETDGFVTRFMRLTASSNGSTDYDLVELGHTVRDFFLGSTHSIMATLLWAFMQLANQPDVQSRLHKEVEAVVGTNRLPALSDEPNMPYTQAVILETMRRYTMLPLALFHQTVCETNVFDFFIPAKSTVIVNLYSAHMDPSKWTDPTVFRPERFIDENGKVTGKDRVISFSLGKRSCTGELLARQELFLFLAGIAQQFEIRPPDGKDAIVCEEKTVLTTSPTPFQLRLLPRQH